MVEEEVGQELRGPRHEGIRLEVGDTLLGQHVLADVGVARALAAGSRDSTAWAASATSAGVREPAIAASPPSRFWTAAVAIAVRGHRQLAATPSPRSASATPSVTIVIPYLLIV